MTALCSRFPASTLDHTFGEDVDVHRIGNKMFALVNTSGVETVTLKALPEDVAALTAEHDAVAPATT